MLGVSNRRRCLPELVAVNKLVLWDSSLGVFEDLGCPDLRNERPVSHIDALRSLTEIGRVPMLDGLCAVGM